MADGLANVRVRIGGLAIGRVVLRLWNSGVVWQWAVISLRLGFGFLLLPLLLRVLTGEELGFHYVLVQIMAVAPLLDFGLSVSINRSVSYAMGGARELSALGLPDDATATAAPNYELVWKLLRTSRLLYGAASAILFLVFGLVGTALVGIRVEETSQPAVAWMAWGITLIGVSFEIYSGWWNSFLRSMNQVVLSARYFFFGYALRLVLACALLLAGGGLLSLPISVLVSSMVIRLLSRRHCLGILSTHTSRAPSRQEVVSLLRTLWPTSWRVGLQLSTSGLAALASTFVIVKLFRLTSNAEYGLSMQIASFVNSMSQVWVAVKWPLIGQFRARQDFPALRRTLAPRVRLMTVTFVGLALMACLFGPHMLNWIGSGKRLLPQGWFVVLLVNTFLECQFAFWTTLLSMENRIPSLWPTVITTGASLSFAIMLAYLTDLGLGAFVLAPLVCGSLFNYWYWPFAGARGIKTSWLRFTFGRSG